MCFFYTAPCWHDTLHDAYSCGPLVITSPIDGMNYPQLDDRMILQGLNNFIQKHVVFCLNKMLWVFVLRTEIKWLCVSNKTWNNHKTEWSVSQEQLCLWECVNRNLTRLQHAHLHTFNHSLALPTNQPRLKPWLHQPKRWGETKQIKPNSNFSIGDIWTCNCNVFPK